jgi:predicted RNA binding protein YcfA (HicA-like mRNA interferase family)
MVTIHVPMNGEKRRHTVPGGTTAQSLLSDQQFREDWQIPEGARPVVNGKLAESETPLRNGDTLSVQTAPGMKERTISRREIERKLKKLGFIGPIRGRGSHDHFKNAAGKRVDIPRHRRDIKIGTIKGIIKQAGLAMSVKQFLDS